MTLKRTTNLLGISSESQNLMMMMIRRKRRRKRKMSRQFRGADWCGNIPLHIIKSHPRFTHSGFSFTTRAQTRSTRQPYSPPAQCTANPPFACFNRLYIPGKKSNTDREQTNKLLIDNRHTKRCFSHRSFIKDKKTGLIAEPGFKPTPEPTKRHLPQL